MLRRGVPSLLAGVMQRIEAGRRIQRELLMESDKPNADLTRAMLDAVDLFETLQIGYALVGGIAAMVYGRSRFTQDVDFVAAADHEQRLAADPQAMKRHRFDPGCTWKLYHDSGARIDLWKDEHAAGIVQRARPVELAGRQVRVADPHDLIAMKLRADRPQDDYDISEILRHQPVDPQAIRRLVTDPQFASFQRIRQRTDSSPRDA